jgi:hypothetical protein
MALSCRGGAVHSIKTDSRTAANKKSLEHLVGDAEHRERYGETEHRRGILAVSALWTSS